MAQKMENDRVTELNYDWLTDEAEVLKAQYKAQKEVAGFTSDEYSFIRRRAKNDLFFLGQGILGYDRLSPILHGNLATWAQNTDNEQFREFLLPRGHFKSTLMTITDGIRIVLPYDLDGLLWPRGLGTNARVCIGHELPDTAARFLFSISGHFLHNPTLIGFFPECVPNKRQHRINKYELELPRSEIWNEPTFDTIGIGGASQGKHYNFLKLDDLFGEKSRDSAAERRRGLDWFDNVQSLFSTFEKDHFDLIGTRWAVDDLYSHAHETYGTELKKYIRSCEERNEQGELVTIFPEEFTPKKLQILKKSRKIYTAQYQNDPKKGSGELQENWKKYYTWVGENVISTRDGEGRAHEKINVRSDTDNIILVDPATTGLGSFVVTATDFKDRNYILVAEKKVWNPSELVERIFQGVQRWQPRIVVIEAVLFSIVYQHWIEREMKFRGIRFIIEPGKTRNREKEDRVRGLIPFFTAGQIFYGEGQTELLEEHDAFGTTENYHILDAIAYGPEFWKRPMVKRVQDGYKASQSLLRDRQTGYSQQ